MKTQHLLFFSLFLVFLTGCLKEEQALINDQKQVLNNEITTTLSSQSNCECDAHVSNEGNTPVYDSAESFIEILRCLSDCLDAHNDNLLETYENLSEEEYNDLFISGEANEWEPLDNFNPGLAGRTLFEKDKEILDNWLDQEEPDWSTYPIDDLSPFDEVFSTLVNEDCQAIINGELINLCEEMVYEDEDESSRSLEWCTAYGWSSNLKIQGNKRLIVRGGLVLIPGTTTSYIFSRARNFKLRNGRWRRHRERLCVSTTCKVRKSPLNSCDRLYTAQSGTKCRNRSALTVRRYNFSYPLGFGQIWHKRTRNQGAEGSAYGSNQSFSLVTPF